MSNINDEIKKHQDEVNILCAKISELRVKQQEEIEAEKEAKKKELMMAKSKEQQKLIQLRETIKNTIDQYNDLASKSNIKTSVGLLTKGGYNIYELEDGETAEGEYFSDYDGEFNKYPNQNRGWFPSSLNC